MKFINLFLLFFVSYTKTADLKVSKIPESILKIKEEANTKLAKIRESILKIIEEDKRKKIEFYRAINKNDYDTINLLLKCNPRIINSSIYGITPIMMAAELGRKEILNLIIEKINIAYNRRKLLNKQDFRGYTALIYATRKNQLNIIQILINEGINKDIRDKAGNNALHHAALLGNTEALTLLIKSEINLNVQNKKGLTALMIASREGHKNIVKILFDAGATIYS